jgi:hypothetical protein
VPKLFARLRQAERSARLTGSFGNVRACQAALADVEKEVNLFVTREFCELIANTPIWQGPPPRVGAVSLATNQIRLELRHAGHGDEAMCLEFENRGGLVVAGVSVPGWFPHMAPTQQIVVYNALAVLFKLAGADRVREQPHVHTPVIEGVETLTVNHRNYGAMPITWQQCVDCWQTAPAPLLDQSSMWFLEPGKNGTSEAIREVKRSEDTAPS